VYDEYEMKAIQAAFADMCKDQHTVNYFFYDDRDRRPQGDTLADQVARDFEAAQLRVVDEAEAFGVSCKNVHLLGCYLSIHLTRNSDGGIDWNCIGGGELTHCFSSIGEACCVSDMFRDHLSGLLALEGIVPVSDVHTGAIEVKPADRFRGYFEGRVEVPLLETKTGGFLFPHRAIPVLLNGRSAPIACSDEDSELDSYFLA
jgi:hypothetical protein